MKFYLKTQGKLFGPYTREQIKSGVRSGKIKSDYLISNSKDGAFKKITQQFLSGESENLSATTGAAPPPLGGGSSFENPTGIHLSKPKRKNIKKSVSRRERLKGSSIAPTAAHAFSHFSSEGARYDSLAKTISKGNEENKSQLLGLVMFFGILLIIGGGLFLVTVFTDSTNIGSFTTEGKADKLLIEYKNALAKEQARVAAGDVKGSAEAGEQTATIMFKLERTINSMLPAQKEKWLRRHNWYLN